MTRYTDALDRALTAATEAGADDVEVSYYGSELYFARFARSRFTQVGEVALDRVRIRARVGRRLAAELCATLNGDELAAAARAAVDAARVAPELDVDIAFADGTDDAPPAALPDTPEELSAANAPSRLAAAFAAAGMDCAGALKIDRRTVATRTSRGGSRHGADALADLQLIAAVDGSSAYAGCAARLDEPIDMEAIARGAADKATRGRNPTAAEPGAIDVVLAPEAVAELIEWMGMASFGADAVIAGTSLLAGRTGQSLCDPGVTIAEIPASGQLAFDAEGTARQPVTFIDAGAVGRPVTDLLSAARLKDDRGSTGHAHSIERDDGDANPAPVHLSMAPGTTTLDDMIAGVDRGLYVTRLHYVNGLLDPRNAVTTGMTRDGTFAIEGGKLAGAVRNMRFTDSMVSCLATDRLGAIGSACKRVPTWWTSGGTITVPPLLIRGFRFTGQSR